MATFLTCFTFSWAMEESTTPDEQVLVSGRPSSLHRSCTGFMPGHVMLRRFYCECPCSIIFPTDIMIHNIWHRALYMMCYCSSHCLYSALGSAAGAAGSRLWIHANKCVCWSGCTQAPAPSHSCSFSPLLPNYASQNIHLLDFIMASLVSHGSPERNSAVRLRGGDLSPACLNISS